MKIALLGYGKEGQASEKYFRGKYKDKVEIDAFKDFTPEQIKQADLSGYDLVLRSPSVPPLGIPNESSMTQYFFDHCPCPIIGVTATKGKGTTCSFIKAILDAHKADAYLVGNIGTPAIEVLDDLKISSVVVYELSSFQLWDLTKSPRIAVIGQIEPDHLNVHKDYAEYLAAKANITLHQSTRDYVVYYAENPETVSLANLTKAIQVPYPFSVPTEIAEAVTLPGRHNLNNAIAAIAAVASYKSMSPADYMRDNKDIIIEGLKSFKGLPHRLEYLGEHKGVRYYDDNFSTNPSSTRVAIESFPNDKVIVIAGGRDKTDNADLPEIFEILNSSQVKKVYLIGESGRALYDKYHDPHFIVTESLEEAVDKARHEAESMQPAIVLMSPAAASFDMFENVYDRGDKFKSLIDPLIR